MNEMIKRSMLLSKTAHKAIGQKRKYTGEDYFAHPLEVYEILLGYTDNEVILSAALLHDVVEDTDITLDFISEEISLDVALVVEMVTDITKPEDGNRAERKKIDREHYKTADYRGKMVKLADIISNGFDIKENDKHFAVTYFKEIGLLLSYLEIDSLIYTIASEMVYDYNLECEEERLQNALRVYLHTRKNYE